jgi:hypothetical protein
VQTENVGASIRLPAIPLLLAAMRWGDEGVVLSVRVHQVVFRPIADVNAVEIRALRLVHHFMLP